MSYNTDLGRVKGDAGTTYIPQITLKNGKQYISYTSNDGTPIPAELAEKEFTSFVYKPILDEDGNLSFTLTSDLVAGPIQVGNIKGPVGNSTIGVKIVQQKPNFNDLSSEEKELLAEGKNFIYVIDSNEAYADVGIFKANGDFVYLENKLRFDNYYTKSEVYKKTETYSRNEIATQLGNIVEQQNAITAMLGDTDAIIIPDDE